MTVSKRRVERVYSYIYGKISQIKLRLEVQIWDRVQFLAGLN